MSVRAVEKEIEKFLASKTPEVICINGRWGVGKTYAWSQYLNSNRSKIALDRYSYISLFGINSLDELKYSIFENSIRKESIGTEPDLASLQENTSATAERLSRKSLWFLQQLPLFKNYIGGLGPVWFGSVRNHIVCIDDIERRGKGLFVRDVLGLVSNLKEHKHCKVVLILNDDALSDDEKEKEDFELYLEKVADAFLKFEPAAADSVRIAFPEKDKITEMVSSNCVTLGMSNIRVIKKIERFVRQIAPIVRDLNERVLVQMAQSITLLGWALYEPKFAPPLDYVMNKRGLNYFGLQKENLSDEESAWNALLDVYGFHRMDELDNLLLAGMRNGFFDEDSVRERAVSLNQDFQIEQAEGKFTQAWRSYHRSFDNNEEEVLKQIYDSFFDNVQVISPLDLNVTVKLLKELKRNKKAAEVIKFYIENREGDRNFFDLDRYSFNAEITDPDVIAAFKAKLATFKEERDPKDLMLHIAGGWRDEDLVFLASLPVGEYYKIFKTTSGDALSSIINNCLQFNRIVNASEPMKQISNLAKEALTLIGKESEINRRRVRKYGIDVKD